MPGLPGSPETTANVAPFSKTGGGSPHLSSEGVDMTCAGGCTPWLAATPIIAAKNAGPQRINLRMNFSLFECPADTGNLSTAGYCAFCRPAQVADYKSSCQPP